MSKFKEFIKEEYEMNKWELRILGISIILMCIVFYFDDGRPL